MFKSVVLSLLLVTSFFSSAANSENCDISGVWNHSAKPAKLYVDLNKGEVSVHSHEDNASSVGLVVLKNLKLDSTSSGWDAQMYSFAKDSFVDVQISPNLCEQLSVSYQGEEVLKLIR